ncbi:MAG: shikimate kinase [Marivibrio sp.]|uniref:shikimate kinase n=1 Tax=Marivibrio sp. TaxID=2039719 RepID=UPI0032EE7EC8
MPARPTHRLVRTVALIGMMGAGKTAIGRQLAKRLGAPFLDADKEIEKAAGCTVAEIFAEHGEAHFRDGERRVIARLLDGPPAVLATGGGAYMNAQTRALLSERATTVWLKADFETLWKRVSKRGHRPLLKTEDPQGTLRRLLAEREPVYAEADLIVDSGEQTKEAMARKVEDALAASEALEETPAP